MISRHQSLVLGILGLHLLLLVDSIQTYSLTVDEVAHLPAGLSHWRFSRFDLYRVNPPLIEMTAAVPLLFSSFNEDWSQYSVQKNLRQEFVVGRRFVEINGKDSIRLYRYGRLACIPFSLIGASAVYWFARHLYGRASGVVAICLWCFSPNVLGNAAIITPDVGGSAMAILAALAFWRWLVSPGLGKSLVAGLTLGLAELAKSTCVILFLIWPILWSIWYWRYRRVGQRRLLNEIGQLFTIPLLGIYLINLGYLFDGSFLQLKEYQFVSKTFGGPMASRSKPNNRFKNMIVGALPVPFPADYVHGIDLQKMDFEEERWSYAAGVHRKRGWWWWYLYAMAVKVPHGTMLLAFMAGVASWQASLAKDALAHAHSRKHRGNETCQLSFVHGDWLVLVPALCILVLVSAHTGFSRYLRYLLPAFPFLFVWISRVTQPLLLTNRRWNGVICIALLWNVYSCVNARPHFLAFFNEASGGSDHGHWHLLDANVDWGQANLALKQWLEKRAQRIGRNEPIYLSCFEEGYGMALDDLGLHGESIPMRRDPITRMNRALPITELPPGLYAISVNHLHAYRHQQVGDPDCSEFLQLKPIAIVGSAIQVFELPSESSDIEK